MQWFKIFNRAWYQPTTAWPYFLTPFAAIYKGIMLARRWWYRRFTKYTTYFDVPLIIVGNITVGGTGKTPLVIWLTHFLQAQGYRPGIVSRGYGGKAQSYPQAVDAKSDPALMGDEAVLLARMTKCPVVVDPNRVAAVKHLLATSHCDVVISDDGLQHYALGRQIEIAVIDGERRFGNEKCLPAGPLREPISRLNSVDFVIANGNAGTGEYGMQLQAGTIYNLMYPELTAEPDDFAGNALHAIAGIGNPGRFFRMLRQLGFTIWPHPFPDHHCFTQQDIQFEADAKVIMTEKDAVKCTELVDYRYWCLPVTAEPDAAFQEALLEKLTQSFAKLA